MKNEDFLVSFQDLMSKINNENKVEGLRSKKEIKQKLISEYKIKLASLQLFEESFKKLEENNKKDLIEFLEKTKDIKTTREDERNHQNVSLEIALIIMGGLFILLLFLSKIAMVSLLFFLIGIFVKFMTNQSVIGYISANFDWLIIICISIVFNMNKENIDKMFSRLENSLSQINKKNFIKNKLPIMSLNERLFKEIYKKENNVYNLFLIDEIKKNKINEENYNLDFFSSYENVYEKIKQEVQSRYDEYLVNYSLNEETKFILSRIEK